VKTLLLSTRRRVVQTLSLVALNTNFWAFASERFCLPVMNCEACLLAWLGCPIGMMGRSLAVLEFPVVVAVSLLVIGVIMGRFMCGWVCPLGFLQDLLHKIPLPKVELPRFAPYVKYAVLFLSVMAVPLWFALGPAPDAPEGAGAALSAEERELLSEEEALAFEEAFMIEEPPHVHNPYFFCKLCPTAAIQVVIPAMVSEGGVYFDRGRIIRFSILAAVLVLATLNHRSFCKVLCPIGALIALTNKLTFHRIKLDPDTCISCKKCNKKCPMDVPVMQSQEHGRSVNRHAECIGCLTCEEVCPTRAITNTCPGLHRPKEEATEQRGN